ncbi:BNR-4 repeat-containing protein [Actinoplanes sp. NPDC026623]|uniref:BNR-4 repeat-containing protein n=1 Tax=Actinoplanes sp. NPDC026623 TaxID=3155610 RepID=UPI0033FB3A55
MTPPTAVAVCGDRLPVGDGLYDAVSGKTFVCRGGHREDDYVQAYDHHGRTWSAPVRVAGGDDPPGHPTMIQAADGHLLVFRGLRDGQLRMARSARPRAIDGTWMDITIGAGQGATYPMPLRTGDGTIFVFIRETAGDPDRGRPTGTRPVTFVRSTDHGRTWRSSASLTGHRRAIASLDRADHMNEIHVGQLRYEPATPLYPERVAIVYTLAGCGPEGRLHDRHRRNLYYTHFTPADLHFHAADGRDLGTTVDDASQEAYLKVVDTPPRRLDLRSPDHISLVGSTLAAWPFVVWMEPGPDGRVRDRVALWSPLGGWRTREVATGVRVRDMERLDGQTWRVYGTDDAGAPGIATYRLTAGRDWRFESASATPGADRHRLEDAPSG